MELFRIRKLPELGFFDVHRSEIRVYPWDMDIFMELNNGRTLTLYDIPRVALAKRVGIWDLIRKRKMALTVAGSAVQYRKRITSFQKITMTAQCVGADEKFMYLLQNCYRGSEPCGQALLRMAFVKDGIVSPRALLKEEFGDLDIPPLEDWVKAYSDAASGRPWPPEEK